MAFYAVKKSLPLFSQKIMAILKNELEEDTTIQGDLKALGDCHEFQKVTGKCDMETFLEFMKRKKRKIPDGAPLRNLRTRLSRGGRK